MSYSEHVWVMVLRGLCEKLFPPRCTLHCRLISEFFRVFANEKEFREVNKKRVFERFLKMDSKHINWKKL